MVITGPGNRVLWAKRAGQDAWQFPQGGIHNGETPQQAVYRELEEEVGLTPEQVECLGVTRDWLRYRLPHQLIRRGRRPLCIGQKQKWFLLRLNAHESAIRFDRGPKPEFDGWRWVDYWLPINDVVAFKQEVYRRALTELAPLIGVPPRNRARRVEADTSGSIEGLSARNSLVGDDGFSRG
jgi:putative (di)nucleoside polyphosphate hydrolase